MIKKLAAISIAVLLLALPVSAAVPEPPRDFFCADFADVLSPQTERYIIDTSADIMKQYDGTQLVVVTIPSLEGNSIEDYSIELAREWGIGKKGEDNGLLILLSRDDRELRVEIGYGLEGIINDAKAGRFIRNVASPYLKEDDFDNGLLELYKALAGELENPTPLEDEEEDVIPSVVTVFFGIFAVIVIISLLGGGSRRPPRGGFGGFGGGFYGGGGHYHGGGFGGGRGGFGGGGFGGGGGFSGGGGGFGGGGASGRF